MAGDEPMDDAPAEQQAPAAAETEGAPAAAPEEAAAPAAAAAPPPSTAKKPAPASTKKKASAKPAAASTTPASTPARSGRERKKVDFFSPPQAVVKEDLVQVKVRIIFFVSAFIHQSIKSIIAPSKKKAHLLLSAFSLSHPLSLFLLP